MKLNKETTNIFEFGMYQHYWFSWPISILQSNIYFTFWVITSFKIPIYIFQCDYLTGK